MLSIFCEYIPNLNIDNSEKQWNLIALTPKACYTLDIHSQYKYNIPDDFCIAEEVDFDIMLEAINMADISPFFMIGLSHTFRAKRYWKEFLKRYKEQLKPTHCLYYGSSFKFLIGILEKEFKDKFHRVE